MKKTNIGICGVFGEGDEFSGGQPVKVKTMIKMFSENIGEESVFTINTYNWKKNIFHLLKEIFHVTRKCDVVMFLPAHNGVKVFAPLFLFLRLFFHYKLVYSVIGGWLSEYTKKSMWLKKILQRVDYIFVETSWMKTELVKQGFSNIFIVNNAKYLTPSYQNKEIGDTIKLCYFSRVMKEKGIEDAVYAVIDINEKMGTTAYCLDIYGLVDNGYKEAFEHVVKSFPNYISYKGCAKPEDSVDILKNYDLQIFPTRFATEGVPGSVIDSYAAGTPVISSRWRSFNDAVVDNVTGFSYEQCDFDDLKRCLYDIYINKDVIRNMHASCVKFFLDRCTPKNVFNEIKGILQWH